MVIIICGPTASGKTQVAHDLAKLVDGEIVCCDSMQIYKSIEIVTDSPAIKLTSEIPYHLYNTLELTDTISLAKYANFAKTKIKDIISRSKIPIIVGGTGLYINALVRGYNEIPTIPDCIKSTVNDLHLKIGQKEFFKHLSEMDPLVLAQIKPNDVQRSIRAYEVIQHTGSSIFQLHANTKILNPLEDIAHKIFYLDPDRDLLYNNCNKRLIDMIQNGAVEEIRNNIMPISDMLHKPITRAIAIAEILSYLRNEISLDEAQILTQTRTRQYAKRQMTWFKNQLHNKIKMQYSNMPEFSLIAQKIYDQIHCS
ncbi:MAG: tRNA (adenosine(37)-N6)-dimethylallyltransferase MiaA [Rickettsiaceae bacterium]